MAGSIMLALIIIHHTEQNKVHIKNQLLREPSQFLLSESVPLINLLIKSHTIL